MAAAASLTPDGENSVYAAARDVCAMTSFYTTTFMLHGHTGGGIGEIWRSAAMGLLAREEARSSTASSWTTASGTTTCRAASTARSASSAARGYDNDEWGAAYALAYTIPRKTLRITGAPPTKFSKPYQLPEQPWGTEADNAFLSLEAVPDAGGKQQDLSGETLAKDSSMPFFRRFTAPGEVSDDMLRQYIHHQDHNIRFVAAEQGARHQQRLHRLARPGRRGAAGTW